MNKSDCLYIVMPAYNEEGNIKDVVSSWYKNLEYGNDESRLVVADKGSTDNTHKILQDMQKNGYEKLELLQNDNQFHGPKLISLYNLAIERERERVISSYFKRILTGKQTLMNLSNSEI